MSFDEVVRMGLCSRLRKLVYAATLLMAMPACGQTDSPCFPPAFQFGTFVGAHYCMLAPWQWDEEEMPSTFRDSISSVATVPEPGFSFGGIYERSIKKNLSLRVLGTFSSLTGSMDYHFVDGTVERVSLERTELGLTVQPLVCPTVRGKGRPYMALGASVGYCPDKDGSLERIAWRLDFGGGVSFPLAGAQCRVEVMAAKSLNDLMIRNGTVYTETLERLELNTFGLRIVFQG